MMSSNSWCDMSGSGSMVVATSLPPSSTTTTPGPIGTATKRPSSTRASSCVPGRRPSWRRSAWGTTMRPALSMDTLMTSQYHPNGRSSGGAVRQRRGRVSHDRRLPESPAQLSAAADDGSTGPAPLVLPSVVPSILPALAGLVLAAGRSISKGRRTECRGPRLPLHRGSAGCLTPDWSGSLRSHGVR